MKERAIGVIYRPDTELQSHYFNAKISLLFDGSHILILLLLWNKTEDEIDRKDVKEKEVKI